MKAQTRKRSEVMAREVFKKFKAGVNAQRDPRDAIKYCLQKFAA